MVFRSRTRICILSDQLSNICRTARFLRIKLKALIAGAGTSGLLDLLERIGAGLDGLDNCLFINIFAEADNGFFHNQDLFANF